MNGRSLTAAAVFLTLAIAAGCIAPNDFLNKSSAKTEISALEDRDLADNAAKAWSPDAQLVSIFAVELAMSSNKSDWPADPHVGNALSPAWVYAYKQADGNGTRAFRVTADGRVALEKDAGKAMDMAGDASHDITDKVQIDSTAALASAMKNEKFAKAMEGKPVTMVDGVACDSDKATYFFTLIGQSGGAYATVDAATGEVIDVESYDMKMDFGDWSSWAGGSPMKPLNEKGNGTVTAEKPKKEFPFEVAMPTQAMFTLSSSGDLPTDGIRWSIVGPDGKALKTQGQNAGGPGMFWGPDGAQRASVSIPQAGDYKVVIEYRSTAPATTPLPIGGSDSFSWTLKAAGEK